MKLPIRHAPNVRNVNVAVLHAPSVQPVHGRHCACRACTRRTRSNG
jgi:hypothetical protein